MVLDEIINDPYFIDNANIVHPASAYSNMVINEKTKYLYKVDPFGEDHHAFWLLNATYEYICDFTETPDDVWEELFNRYIQTGTIVFKSVGNIVGLDKICIKHYNISDLTQNQLHDIIDRNIAYFNKLKLKREQMSLIKLVDNL
jgi:hypothetical protein